MPASKFLTASLGISALAMAALFAPSAAMAGPGAGLSALTTLPDAQVQQVQWRRHGGYGWGGPRYYGRRHNDGAAVAAGVLGGLALGAVIAGAASAPPPVAYAPPVAYGPPPGAGDWYAYCASKYRSFDPASGTYLGYDGLRHPCQ